VRREQAAGRITPEEAAQAIGTLDRALDQDVERAAARDAERAASGPAIHGLGLLDSGISALYAFAYLVTWAAWLVVVAPAQYFVYLVTGAPARAALKSGWRAKRSTTDRAEVLEAGPPELLSAQAKESGFTASPVAFTSAVTAATLYAVSLLV
jgi:hypothetical protein